MVSGKKLGLAFVCIIIGCTSLLGQQNALFTNYYMNPYLINPAYVGHKGYTSVMLNYRQQWAGIQGAPVTTTFNLTHPLDHKMSLGLYAENDERGVLNSTKVMATYGYNLYFGRVPSKDHHLSFGLSVGAEKTSINMDEVENPNDPAISNILDNNYSMTGAVGAYYQFKELQIGFTLPRLFKTDIVSTDRFNFNELNVEQLKYTTTSVRYKFQLSYNLAVESWLLYRTDKGFGGQLEGLGVLHINDRVAVGGGYRQNYSAFFTLGLKVTDQFKIGYGYEMAGAQVPNLGQGTHEFQLTIKLGKKNKLAKVENQGQDTAPPLAYNEEDTETSDEEAIEQPADDENINETPEGQPEHYADNTLRTPVPAYFPDEKYEEVTTAVVNNTGMAPGHYVIAGAFEQQKNANKYVKTLKRAGFDVEVHYHYVKRYYYVSFPAKTNLFTARQLLRRIRATNLEDLPKAWVLTIE